MRSLTQLLESAEGRHFLDSEGVFTSTQAFKDQLHPPAKPQLAISLEAKNSKLVCAGQQLYVDYRQSVLAKIEILRDIAEDDALLPFFLWVDTDRSGSDNLISKFAWPTGSKKGPITILPPGTRDVEIRYAELDPQVLSSAVDKLGTYLRGSEHDIDGAKERYQQLKAFFTDNNHGTLAQFNLQLTQFLLNKVFAYAPRPIILSSYLDQDSIIAETDHFLNRITDVIQTFNEAIETMVQQDIDPQMRPLPENYLPLFYSCEVDEKRLRLSHEIIDQDHFAVAQCKCGQQYRFHLGKNSLSIAELAQSNRWSPDVCFPIFFNDLVSGFVAGKSSTLYLILMNTIMRKVLAKTPVPILAPTNLQLPKSENVQFDSLLYRYLAGLKG